jgi:hypothetical protein
MSAESPASLSVVLDVIGILEDLGVRYHLGGSFASTVHGVPRQTMDADLVVDLNKGHIDQLIARLQNDFYADRQAAVDAVTRRSSFNAIHLATGFKVDFFIKGDGEFDEAELARSQLTQVVAEPPRTALVKSAEDTVLRKLQWFRKGGEVSDRQWRDVLGILMTVGDNLEDEYLDTWAQRLEVVDLLERARRQIDSG